MIELISSPLAKAAIVAMILAATYGSGYFSGRGDANEEWVARQAEALVELNKKRDAEIDRIMSMAREDREASAKASAERDKARRDATASDARLKELLKSKVYTSTECEIDDETFAILSKAISGERK